MTVTTAITLFISYVNVRQFQNYLSSPSKT